MKKLVFTLLAISFVWNLQSQENQKNNKKFMCSIGNLNNSKYPPKIKEIKFDINKIKPLSNGRLVPIFFKIKEDVQPIKNWFLISDNDTTKIKSINIESKDKLNALFIVYGERFSKSLDMDGFILDIKNDSILFQDKNNKKFKLIKEKL